MAEWTDATWEEHSGKVMVGCSVEKKELMKEFSKGIHLAEKLDHWLVGRMESALESTKDEKTEAKAADSSGDLMESYSESRWAGLKDTCSVDSKEIAMADCWESSKVESLVDHLAELTVGRKVY
jgi:hypothetical protein